MNPATAETRVRAAIAGLGLNPEDQTVSGIRSRGIHLHVEPGARQDEHLISARACANVLSRIFNQVTISGVPGQALLPNRHPRLPRPLQPGEVPDLVLAFTDAPTPAYPEARVLYVDNRGWTAYLGTTGPWNHPPAPINLLAAYFAGCWAAADAFNHRFAALLPRIQTIIGYHTFDLLTLQDGAPPRIEPDIQQVIVDLDDVALVGVGSIGQAFVEALGYLPSLRGRIHLIDHEDTDESNESRYPLSFPHNRGHPKVQIASDHLRNLHPTLQVTCGVPVPTVVGANLQVRPQGLDGQAVQLQVTQRPFQPMAYEGVMRARVQPFKTMIVAVDSASVRRDIQMGLHGTVFNSWTFAEDGQVAFCVGRHEVDGRWGCLACMYHMGSTDEPTAIEFAQRITGWSQEKVTERLITNRDQPTSQSEVEALAARRGIPPEHWPGLVGKRLADVIHQACGLASFSQGDRNVVAPVAHATAMAGTLLATAVIRQALGLEQMEHLAIYDCLRPPNKLALQARRKVPGCLCQDGDVQRVYADEWGKGTNTEVQNDR
jgi:hypothetical protein